MNSRIAREFLRGKRPLAFAHRGGSALWPENTLVAFQGALDKGIRYLETDLHVTHDGKVVIFHDARLERTTDGIGLLKDKTLSELRNLDAGYRFTENGRDFPWRGRGLVVPTFEELVDLSSEARFNIELKNADPRLMGAVWAFIERRGLHDRVLVAAERDQVVRAFRKLSRGSVATSAGRREVELFWAASRIGASSYISSGYDALQVPPRSGPLTVVDRRFLTAAHDRGIDVHVWTIDDPQEMRRLLDLGVDAVMTDRPDRLLEVLRERAAE